MQYGLKLHPRELEDAQWRAAHGRPEEFLARARELGVGFVELTYGEEMAAAELVEAGRRCAAAGLSAAVHPYLHGALAPEVFADPPPPGLPALLAAGEERAALTGRAVPMVFHGGLANAEPHHRRRREAVASARAFFAWLDGQARRACSHVRVFNELQMPIFPHEQSSIERVGDTWRTCLELVAGTDVGVCWDFGHGYGSSWCGKHQPLPPGEFLARVGHVHAHDALEVDGRLIDHRPLGEGVCPWRAYFRLLAEAGFDGWILFETALQHPRGWGALAETFQRRMREIDAIFGARG
jgi:sugar phosphate isomerase/epimerase